MKLVPDFLVFGITPLFSALEVFIPWDFAHIKIQKR